MALTTAQIEQQKKQAEELLFSGPQTLGFAKGLFFGHFNAPLLFPYPRTEARGARPSPTRPSPRCVAICDEHIDAAAIDRNAEIPAERRRRPGQARRAGHDGARRSTAGAASRSWPTRAIMEVIGGHCAVHGRLRQRPPQHRHSRAAAVRHRGAETPLAAAAGQRREARRLRADRAGGRLRRRQRADHRHARRRTARPTSSTAANAGSPTAASPTC